ncbi:MULTISPECIES: ABC transporter ATP-binding protein [unclassified Enterococcus]|uniref:ABC transporter ATP-binding protein n=1 Tax=unclassified Enterococcus TaxID=2608891 RepID=UPI0015537427|nr:MULTISPECIES: ABC transporter ATP-binding protein [unclassified Enterococcus]MBS7576390.1 ABC transporter ATP-binding protein [Enterococcus sp. MMGLQ5-2]MBS7583622.1 ABC transporter ATP-binding protein [Enterococcus sp. MMGLQ5-1]NPD11483.1 ABC transporter ATP-binding protein [Enterococcus sp. MMGLQ5-1]NPD36227.1 ABC transporter ATP-binding protein [Enterococcus sp. MMGLQ5-2]
MQLLKQFIKQNKGLLFLSILFITINTFAMLVIPFYVSQLINEGILKQNYQQLNTIIVKMLIILIIGTIAGILGSYFSAYFSSKFAQSNRKKMIRTIEKLTLNQTDHFGIASLVTRTTNDNVNAQQILLTFLQMILPSPIMALIAILLTLNIYPVLAIIPLLAIFIFLGTTWYVLNQSLPNIQKIQAKMDQMTLVLREFFVGVRIIRAFDNSKKEKIRVDTAFEDYTQNNIVINQHFALLSPMAFCLMNLAMVLILWIGSSLVAHQVLEIGSITALIEYTTTTIATLIMSALILFQVPKGIASINRIQEVIETKSEITDHDKMMPTATLSEKITPITQLSFNNVDFRYSGAEKKILDAISFKVNAGETIAIVGGTGSGKSSVVKTLLRLNDIEAGTIKINDIDIRDMPLDTLRHVISYVPQRAFLFSGTISDNFRFGCPDLTNEQMIKVAKVAQANDFIQGLPEKFQTKVTQGGTNFSGGQKQRLAIGRALAKNAGIYIFDDSFSALDYATDALLRSELKTYLAKQITIIVAQRLSTILSADQIIVLNDGKIVGRGSHESLLATNQFYQDLAKTQGIMMEVKK